MSGFDFEKLKDPQYFAENRLPVHSDHIFYRDEAELARGVSSFYRTLGGIWHFAYARNTAHIPQGFEAADYDCRDWETIRVPAHIQMEGHGVPHYTNTTYPWDGHESIVPGEIPVRDNPVGCYVKYFAVPEDWERVYISFGGVDAALALFLNGHFVGYSEDSCTPADFDLTPYLVTGENKLAAMVFRYTSASWLEDQDFWRFSGIYRDVLLYTKLQHHVEDISVRAVPLERDGYTHGKLDVHLTFNDASEKHVEILLCDSDGDCVEGEEAVVTAKSHVCSMEAACVLLWSAEHPWLYHLMIRVRDAAGVLQEVVRVRVVTERKPLYQGGFIWDFGDQAIRRRGRYGEDVFLYGGDFGDRPSDYNFSGNGIFFADRRPTAKLQEVKYNYQNFTLRPSWNGVEIENKSLFSDAGSYDLWITLLLDGREIWQAYAGEHDVPPGETRFIKNRLPYAGDGEYVLTASLVLKEEEIWAPAGHEVAFRQAVVVPPEDAEMRLFDVLGFGVAAPAYMPLEASGSLRVVQGDINLGVQGKGFSLMFSSAQGNLVSYRYGGRELIEELPQPSFWRAPIDNDYGSGRMEDTAQWKLASLYRRCTRIEYSVDGEDFETVNGFFGRRDERCAKRVTVRFTYALATEPAAACMVAYTVEASGVVGVTMEYETAEGMPEMPDFAMIFMLDADYDRIRFYGYGPKENYIDRCCGARLDIYESTAADEAEPYLRPQETGNHCGVRWIEVTDRSGHGIRLAGDAPFEASALPYSPHELENARHAYDLPRPQHTYLRASAGMCGVGGDDSWGAPVLAEYTYPNGKRSLSFKMKGI